MRPASRLASRHSFSCQHRGLTLIELLVAIAVLAIIATIGLPSFQQFTARNEVAAEVMRIKTALALARNTAVTRRTTISVCPRATPSSTSCNFTDWSHPIVVVLGQAPSGDLTSTRLLKTLAGRGVTSTRFNRNYPIRFQATGWAKGHNGTFEICGEHTHSASIVVNSLGRARVQTSSGAC